MILKDATAIADQVRKDLAPACIAVEIAGSVRRRCAWINDIEIVAIPKPYNTGLFADGIAPIIDRWEKAKGELPCLYTQRIHPAGITLDIFFATPENWGLIFAIRTGSADYSHHVLAKSWTRAGYTSTKGMLHKDGTPIPVPTEEHLYSLISLPYAPPWLRTYQPPTPF